MLKSLVRGAIGETHYSHLIWSRERFGVWAAVLGYLRMLVRGDDAVLVPLPRSREGVYLRPGTADRFVFDEIFVQQEYAVECANPGFIIDGGAHIGLASVFFATRYPDARVVAVEPEPGNFSLLVRNARPFPNILPLNAGLWGHVTTLQVEDSGVDTWSFRLVERTGGVAIPAVTVDHIASTCGADRIGILKLDIEGTEVEVLSTSQSWISRVDTLIIELHDRFRSGCSEALRQATNRGSYRTSRSGESIVLRRTDEG